MNVSLVVAGVVAELGWGADPAQGLAFEPPSITALDVLASVDGMQDEAVVGLDCSRTSWDGYPLGSTPLLNVTLVVSGKVKLHRKGVHSCRAHWSRACRSFSTSR